MKYRVKVAGKVVEISEATVAKALEWILLHWEEYDYDVFDFFKCFMQR